MSDGSRFQQEVSSESQFLHCGDGALRRPLLSLWLDRLVAGFFLVKSWFAFRQAKI